jgi:hypothetical protein
MTDKIADNIAAALKAIVERESAGYQSQFDASAARLVVQKQKLDRLLTALDEVKRQVAGFDEIEVHVPVHRHMASVKVDNRRFSISTDMANAKFTVEENYWSHADGRNVELFTSYETDDEVLRLVMESIGKFIALQKVIEERRAAAAGPI